MGKVLTKYTVRLNFTWDDEDNMQEFNIWVPENVALSEIGETLIEAHNYLCHEDEEDIYGTEGRIPATLLNFVCEKHNWEWDNLEFDIDFNFD